jgi:hypothetical protein
MKLLLCVLLTAALGFGQSAPTTIQQSDRTISVFIPELNTNFTNLYKFPRQGTLLPSTCGTGEGFVLTLTVPYGLYYCTSTNTWTAESNNIVTGNLSVASGDATLASNGTRGYTLIGEAPSTGITTSLRHAVVISRSVTSNSGVNIRGATILSELNGPSTSGNVTGATVNVQSGASSTGTLTSVTAGQFQLNLLGTTTVTNAHVVTAAWFATGTSPVTTGSLYRAVSITTPAGSSYGSFASVWIQGGHVIGGSMTSLYGLKVDTLLSSGTPGSVYGVWVQSDPAYFGGTIISPLVTPASSSSACTTGQFENDASYHYVCTSTNTWKRVALSSF